MNLRTQRLIALAAAGIFTGVLVAACGNGEPPEPTATPTPEHVTVEGVFALASDRVTPSCRGEGGYSDITPGTEVLLTSGTGDILDVTRLGDAAEPEYLGSSGCVYTFELSVPRGHEYYTVEVGSRGSFTYTFEEITDEGTLMYSMGS